MNIEIPLKSRSYILDLDHVKLSLGIFLFLSCLMKIFFASFQDIPFFCQKHTPKGHQFYVSPNFTHGKGSLVVSLECHILIFEEA